MPPFLLIALLLFTATTITKVFILTPLELIRHLNLPNWLLFGGLLVVFLWCFGEE